ncbi:MAG: hypothetical protein QMC83_06125 [Thermodesulfovibrionales bacterium]|nr:hypothetical protein [Thermodesulfovibrionales bacterium]
MIRIGDKWRGKIIREVINLSNGWIVIKTDNKKSTRDFKVKTITSFKPRRSFTPKHAHFAIDFYGKLCADIWKTLNLLKAIVEVWYEKPIERVIKRYKNKTTGLPGYNLEYILYALKWILEQEDINFKGRPDEKQKELDDICKKQKVRPVPERKGSQLAISLLCDISNSTHPVDALLKANLDVKPLFRLR